MVISSFPERNGIYGFHKRDGTATNVVILHCDINRAIQAI